MDRASDFYSKPSTMSPYPIYETSKQQQRGGRAQPERFSTKTRVLGSLLWGLRQGIRGFAESRHMTPK